MRRFVRRFIDMIRSFFGSEIIQCFFVNKKYARIAYGGIVLLMIFQGADVYGAYWSAQVMSKLYGTFQNPVTKLEYHEITMLVVFIYSTLFWCVNLLTYYTKMIMGMYWRCAMRHGYGTIAEENSSKIRGLSQRVIDGPEQYVEPAIDFGINVYRAIIGFISFVAMLWVLSEHFQFMVEWVSRRYLPFVIYAIPGFLLWVLAIWCLFFETGISWLFGRIFKLKRLEAKKQGSTAFARAIIEKVQQYGYLHDKVDAKRMIFVTEEHEAIDRLWWREWKLIRNSTPLVLWKGIFGYLFSLGPLLLFGYYVAVPLFSDQNGVLQFALTYAIMQQTLIAMGEIHKALGVGAESWSIITKLQGTGKRMREIEPAASSKI